jgi:hypothetical protein
VRQKENIMRTLLMLAVLFLGAFLNFGCGEDTDPLPEPEHNIQYPTCGAGQELVPSGKADGSMSCIKIEQEPQPPVDPPPPPPCPVEYDGAYCQNDLTRARLIDESTCTWQLYQTSSPNMIVVERISSSDMRKACSPTPDGTVPV